MGKNMERSLQKELEKKSEDILKRVEKIEKEFLGLHNITVGTETYWDGSAGKLHRDIEKERYQQTEEVLNRLEKQIKKGRASILGKTEREIEREKEILPIDIFR